MSNEAVPADETDGAEVTVDAATVPAGGQPWISRLAVIACIGIFLAIRVTSSDSEASDGILKFGWLPADEIWKGRFWPLFTTAFIHIELWHAAFNIYWLWILGSRMERVIGSRWFLVLFLVAAVVSSAYELAVSGGTGIGASGVVYAIFGFMWVTRHRYPSFGEVLDSQTIQIFVLWLVGCIVATFLDIANVGNAAHASGLAFGAAVAAAFVLQWKRPAVMAGLAGLVGVSIATLFWSPWSVSWQACKALNAHEAGEYERALTHYDAAIRLEPETGWMYLYRSYVYQDLHEPAKADADKQKAFALDPSLKTEE